jgi:predicted naringenin-chalcone synthase
MAPSTAFERRMDSHARRPLIAFLFVAWNSARSITPFIGATSACIGNALFADGAGAVVLGSTAKGADDACRWWLAATASCVFPNTADAMTWSIGNHGFEMTISTELPRLTQENLSGWLTAWLERQGLAVSDVNLWAVHPGGPRIVEAVAAAMGLTTEQTAISRDVLSAYGNMSSAMVLYILESLFKREAQPPCVMLGFGPGLVGEAALFV